MRRSEIYAVIRSGGKQYKVKPDQLLDVERLRADVGTVVELPDVLMVADGDDVTVGQPRVTGARVVAEVMEHGRGPKLIVFKYKNKTRYRKKTGHRQAYTRLAIRQILIGAESVAAAAPPKARPRRAPPKPVVETQATLPEAAEAPPAEEQPTSEAPQVEEETVAAEAPPEAAAEAEGPQATAVEGPAPAEAGAPAEAPKARRQRAAAPKATDEAPPKPARPRPAPRTKREE
ncbi:MAG TPA: 50S ribosomal protein L21 [Dehalococcoidia bacterium]|nr:50S ribosomal protein L21 [Dehalococcoidia bacterium]